MPKWSKHYTKLIQAMLLYHEGREITSHLRESLIKGLDKMKSFRHFAVDFCPELVFFLNQQEPHVVLEDVLSRVLLIAKKGCYLGKNLIKGLPQTEVLAEGIDAWYGKGTMTAHHYKLLSRYSGFHNY
ncbi:MAG: hypothetical protein U0Z75_06855 [Deinococcaceae bacterium]